MDDYEPLPPPAYGYPDDEDDVLPRPGFVLIEQYAYLADRNNATTAACRLSGPDLTGSIKVTFCAVRPPLVSYLCVHATDYDHTDFTHPPTIVATDGPLAVLRTVFRAKSALFDGPAQFFVYHAGADGTTGEKERKARLPSLHHIPSPHMNYTIGESTVTLLRRCTNHRFDAANRRRHGGSGQDEEEDEDHDCEACGYVLAAAWSSFTRSTPHQICLYHSDKETWTFKTALAPGDGPYRGYCAHKSIGVGGDDGVVAWVDLKRGIVLCDALAESPTVRLVGLPPLMPPFQGVSSGGNARYGRGVAMADGSLRYTQLACRIVPGSYEDDGSVVFDGWRAATWSWKIAADVTGSSSSLPSRATWHMDYQLDSAECASSLPEVLVAGQSIPFERLHIGLPVPSMQEDGVVYYLGKIDHRDSEQTACVVAVDMRNKTVRGTAEFGAKTTVGLGYGYVSSTISRYLRVASPRM